MANLADHLFRQAAERGGKTALIFEDQSFTYAEIAGRVRRNAGGLSQMGIGIGTHVGLMLNSHPDFIFFQQALFALGAVVSPLNIFYKQNELTYAIASCELEFLIMGQEFMSSLPASAPSLTCVLVIGLALNGENGIQRSASRVTDSAAQIEQPVSLPADALGLLLNTSATTGNAKAVMLSIANIQANYDQTPQWLGLDETAVILCVLPLYNTFGLNQGINAAMVTGATMLLMPRFEAAKCLATIERHRCTFFPAVPTMLQQVFNHPDAGRYDLSSIRRIMTGAAPVPAALLERIHAVADHGAIVMSGYGLTEATAIVALHHIELDANRQIIRPKSIGKVLPGIEMKIFAGTGTVPAPGEVGEICIRGPNIMQGYYKMPDETAQAIIGGWLHTGDLGTTDEEGYFSIVDRKKDIIIRGGQNIYPAEIEEVIYDIPGVREVAVIGAPDDRLGEVPVAYIAAQSEDALTAAGIIAHCKAELAYFKVPAAVHFLPELPKGPTGKILRRKLRPC